MKLSYFFRASAFRLSGMFCLISSNFSVKQNCRKGSYKERLIVGLLVFQWAACASAGGQTGIPLENWDYELKISRKPEVSRLISIN